MRNQQLAPVPAGDDAPLPVLTHGHDNGLDQLRKAFEESRSVAIVIGEPQFQPDYLIGRFLAERDDAVGKLRVTNPGSDDDAAICNIARAVGFDLQEVSLDSLENELRNFLACQKHNDRRTIICLEEIQHDSRPTLEIARRLAELEAAENYGLMLVLSGPPDLHVLLSESPFDALCAYAGQRIALGPFTLVETRQSIEREVAAAGFSDVGQVFDYDAITRIHELCSGIPDKVETLCCKCIEMIAGKGTYPITAEVADAAGRRLWPENTPPSSRTPIEMLPVNGSKAPIGRLIARMHGVTVKEQALNHGHILIGRSPLCDIHVSNSLVSRHHALVVKSASGLNLIDLGSTNGTFVGDRQVQQSTLQNGDVITIGDCQIAYDAGEDQPDPS